MTPPIVLFDGVCNLCVGSVQWLIRHDPADQLRFASLQSPIAGDLLGQYGAGGLARSLKGLVLIDHGRVLVGSSAALGIAHYLRRPWRWLAWLRIVPRPIRDAAYRLVARHRYRLFGRQEACWLPTPELEARFLKRLP